MIKYKSQNTFKRKESIICLTIKNVISMIKKLKEDIKNLKIVVSPIPFMIKKEILLNGYVIQI